MPWPHPQEAIHHIPTRASALQKQCFTLDDMDDKKAQMEHGVASKFQQKRSLHDLTALPQSYALVY